MRSLNFSQRGLSLVELMVAAVIALLLLVGVANIFIGSQRTYAVQDGMSRLQENARFTLDRLTQDIGAAGYLGCLDSGDADYPVVSDLANKAPGTTYDFSTPVFGQDGVGPNTSDTLIVRRGGASGRISVTTPMATKLDNVQLDSSNPAYDQLEQFDVVAIGDCNNVSIFMITNDPTTSGGVLAHSPSIVASSGPNQGQSNLTGDLQFIYGALTASVANSFKLSSTTYLLGASTSGNGNSLYINDVTVPANELIEGVEDFQVTYGVNTDNILGADRFVDANNVTAGGTDWNDVVAVRIFIRLNTVEAVEGVLTSKDFVTTIRLRNRGETI